MKTTIALWVVSVLGVATPSVSFQPPVSATTLRRGQHHDNSWRRQQPTPTPIAPAAGTTSSSLSLSVDPSYLGGSFLWSLNFYFGFDWLLAPLGAGLDSDFNPAYRTATFLGSLQAGKSPGEAYEATKNIVDEDGERPEMGSRLGSGANVGYVTEIGNSDDDGNAAAAGESDWLSDREAGLRSSAPLPLQLVVAVFYAIVGLVAMALLDSLTTAVVLSIPALVYEIGRPSLPTREEAIFDAKLDRAVTAFAGENMLLYGQEILPEGVAPVRRDEATNERELVSVFRRKHMQRAGLQDRDVSDFQIEMRFREMGTGRSEGGYIKGVRLLREPVSWQ